MQKKQPSMKKLLLTTLFLTLQFTKNYGQVGIGTTNPSTSSALDINSTNSGLLIPRINLTSTTDVTTIANPATSLLVYNTATVSDVVPGYYYWNTKWILLQDSSRTNNSAKYGELFRTSNTLLSSSNEISFGSNGPNNGVTLNSSNIKITTAGDYKLTYTVSFLRGVGNGSHSFYLKKNSSRIQGSNAYLYAVNGAESTLTKTKFLTLAAGDTISIYYDNGDPITLYEGTSLSVELIK